MCCVGRIGNIRFFIYFLFLFDEALDYAGNVRLYTIHIGSTPTIMYFDLYLYSAYAAHYVYFNFGSFTCVGIDV